MARKEHVWKQNPSTNGNWRRFSCENCGATICLFKVFGRHQLDAASERASISADCAQELLTRILRK